MATESFEAVFDLPMPLERAAIDHWIGVVVGGTDHPTQRAEALIELQDRQAMHAQPWPALVQRSVEAWLTRVWSFETDFLDAAVTVALNFEVGHALLVRTRDDGPPDAQALALEGLAEWVG